MHSSKYDDAASSATKHVIPLQRYEMETIISAQVDNSLFLVTPKEVTEGSSPSKFDRTYHSNNGIWEAIILEKVRRTDINILLDSFFIFEWLPRSPGLYYTEQGRYARKEAKSRILEYKNGVIVYDTHGKMSMLDGGIGNVRLKPIQLNGAEYYFISASSDGQCDEGFPVAVPEYLFNEIIDEISERGTVVRNLVGTLKFIPNDLQHLYHGYREVPKLYLKVDSLSQPGHPKARRMEELNVNVAVSFASNFESQNRLYASYVGFDPSDKRSFKENIKWMEEEYVEKLYKGKVVTDFDELTSHFENAPFSLKKVMSLNVDEKDFSAFPVELAMIFRGLFQDQSKVQVNIKELYMESKYKITGGTQGIVGDDARNNIINQNLKLLDGIDLQSLAEELALLQEAAKREPTTSDHAIEVGAIASAESAARKGDKPKLLEYLKSFGKWTLDIATNIGTSLLTEVIKKTL